MTSQRKIAANRSNSQRSSGPRTADGKRKASGNSRKHGWAALERRLPTASPAIEQLAKALSGDAQDPALLAQARIIAENDLMGTAIRLEKIRTIEMLVAEAKMSDDEFFQRRLDRLLAAIFAKFKGVPSVTCQLAAMLFVGRNSSRSRNTLMARTSSRCVSSSSVSWTNDQANHEYVTSTRPWN